MGIGCRICCGSEGADKAERKASISAKRGGRGMSNVVRAGPGELAGVKNPDDEREGVGGRGGPGLNP